MKRLRLITATLLFVVAVFFNIERFDWGQQNLVDIQTFVYLLTTAAVVSILVIPSRYWRHISLAVLPWVALYFVGKLFFSSRPLVGGIYTYLSVTELFFLILCAALSYALARQLQVFEKNVRDIVLVQTGHPVPSVEEASAEIHTEITRSRHYKRPLSVVLIEPDAASLESILNQTVHEVEQALRTHYAQAKIAQVMREQVRIFDHVLASGEDGRFVILCPEADMNDSQVLAQHIEDGLNGRLNVKVHCGIASFPDEGLTFGGLLQRAGEKLKSTRKEETSPEPLFDKHPDSPIGMETPGA
ncbi:MAG: hypothetical protein KC441_14035 [Anaerolineales bacterium]|nr:hypothetical protein [Anaerolineales bacterium]